MPYKPNKHHRRSIRLKGYDYSRAGLYFITICTHHRLCLFGNIENGEMILNDAGRMVQNEWLKLPKRFSNIQLHEYVVMPNHFHSILEITVGATLVVAQNDGVVAQNDGVVAQNDGVVAQNDGVVAQNDGVVAQNDGVVAENDGVVAENDGVVAQNDGVVAENDGVVAENDGVVAENDGVVAENDGVVAENDGVVAQNDGVVAQNDGVVAENDGVVAENDGVLQRDNGALQRDKKGQPQGIAPTKPKTIGDMVGAFQSIVTVEYIRGVKQLGWQPFNGKLLQRNYWEHIIRNEQSYQRIAEYIINNPKNWDSDKLK